ncbi:hypothetical protein LQZ18_01545 [Lachnospiraceae bacterium ZAX-1]
MNRLKLKEANENYVIYFYQPDGEGAYGEILVNIGDHEAKILTKPDSDQFGTYAFKATRAIIKCIDEKNFPPSFIQAWY